MVLRAMTSRTAKARRVARGMGIRPVTLLIVFGIVLITGILIATGIGADQLRQQSIASTDTELGRIDGVLAAVAEQSFDNISGQLAEVATRLRQAGADDAASLRTAATTPEIATLLAAKLDSLTLFDGLAVLDASGDVLSHAGNWPEDSVPPDQLVSKPGKPGMLGDTLKNAKTGSADIPVAHRLTNAAGAPIGSIVGLVPVDQFIRLFAMVPLPDDTAIILLHQDGIILAQHAKQPEIIEAPPEPAILQIVTGDTSMTMSRHIAGATGEWRIEALRALPDYPAVIVVSRGGAEALAGWTHAGLWFGACAMAAALTIGVMVYLVAHQFEIHAAFIKVRTEKAEGDRARLVAEAELLKVERLSVLGQLTATVAHELRNPLSAIRNTLFTVKELAANQGVKLDRPVARMERSIERCDRIISDLLEFTRTRELRLSAFGFDRWISDVIAEQSIPSPATLSFEPGAGDTNAQIDSDRMRRVVINLIENAAQAMNDLPPDKDRRITLKTTVIDSGLVLDISDTGPGIPPENLSRIFEPLFSTKSFGTGLGLPTVKQIVNQHGGTIVIASEPGEGTHVTVTLPLEAEHVEDAQVAAA